MYCSDSLNFSKKKFFFDQNDNGVVNSNVFSSKRSLKLLLGSTFKQGLKAKSMMVFKVRTIVLDWIGFEFIHLYPAVLEIFHFKHDAGSFPIIIFIGNPDVGNIGDVILVLSKGNTAIRLSHRGFSTYI